MTKEDRPKCFHPENYGKECSSENCPEKNEWGYTIADIMIATADGHCDYGSWCERPKKVRCKDCKHLNAENFCQIIKSTEDPNAEIECSEYEEREGKLRLNAIGETIQTK